MKKVFIIFVLIISCLILPACKGEEEQNLSSYNLDLTYHEESRILEGQEEVCYQNNTSNAFDQLYFHLYPNAFREGAKRGVVSLSHEVEAYPSGKSYGNIEILSVSVEGERGEFEICGEDQNILAVSLFEILYPDESVNISISFKTTLAIINHRLGAGENTINFGNFYPIACVYEEGKGFKQDLYHSNGDPFYSDCANYSAIITFSSSFDIASSGKELEREQDDGLKSYHIEAKSVRDFCFVLSGKFEEKSQLVAATTITYYGYKNDNDLQECLDISVKALETFNDLFGLFPYPTLSVVKSNFVHGGMEYPGLVLISDEVKDEDVCYVIVHEIAHQWWYGVVGNDEYNHAWLDEGLAEYSTLMFYRQHEKYGENFKDLIAGANQSYHLFEEVYKKVNGNVDTRMDRPLNEFATEPEYVQCTYIKGTLMLHSIEESVGRTKFLRALQSYFETFKFKNASPEDFIAIFEKTCHARMEGYIKSWIEGKIIVACG